MKIYTKRGDLGKTSLFSGKSMSKDAAVFAALGDLDELNAFIGYLALEEVLTEEISSQLYAIQNTLFNLGSKLAMEDTSPAFGMDEQAISSLEELMDGMDLALKPLRNFILPGGNRASALCHLCRTICRRAERSLVSAGGSDPSEMAFMNRLSDYFFVLARFLTHFGQGSEVIWDKSARL